MNGRRDNESVTLTEWSLVVETVGWERRVDGGKWRSRSRRVFREYAPDGAT